MGTGPTAETLEVGGGAQAEETPDVGDALANIWLTSRNALCYRRTLLASNYKIGLRTVGMNWRRAVRKMMPAAEKQGVSPGGIECSTGRGLGGQIRMIFCRRSDRGRPPVCNRRPAAAFPGAADGRDEFWGCGCGKVGDAVSECPRTRWDLSTNSSTPNRVLPGKVVTRREGVSSMT